MEKEEVHVAIEPPSKNMKSGETIQVLKSRFGRLMENLMTYVSSSPL